MILGTLFAILAGEVIASQVEYTNQILGKWVPGFIYTFFPLACVVLMQWLLLSDYLPKWWITLGIIGSAVAGTIVGLIFLYVSSETYNAHQLEIGSVNAIVSGMLAALPQWFLLKGRKGYLWVLANGLGRTIRFVGWYLIFYPPVDDSFFLAFARMLILESPVIPLGLMLGLYLFKYILKPQGLQPLMARN